MFIFTYWMLSGKMLGFKQIKMWQNLMGYNSWLATWTYLFKLYYNLTCLCHNSMRVQNLVIPLTFISNIVQVVRGMFWTVLVLFEAQLLLNSYMKLHDTWAFRTHNSDSLIFQRISTHSNSESCSYIEYRI